MSEQLQLRRGTASQVLAFTGAAGEVVADTTNNRLVLNDGVTVGGVPHAKLSEVITNARTPISDVAYTALASDRMVAYTTLTVARVVTLPASSAYPLGTQLLVVDESGNCSMTKTITLTAAGSDTINGAASAVVNVAYGRAAVETNQAGQWTLVETGFASALKTEAAAAHGANIQFEVLETSVTLSGASTNASLQIPANCVVLAVGSFVVTAITGTATSYEIGVAGNLSQFGSGFGLPAGSNNFGLIGPTAFYSTSARTLTVTATGGSFTGGVVRLNISIMLANPSAA